MMNKGEKLAGFKVLEVVPVEECNSTGIWLRHERTGLEVFHLLNEDAENLFAFAFRTPPKDSTGAAHVLEHSVLCGSQTYPVKDPFIRLANQSVKTFLNAWTASDRTVFPASSQVKEDYYNLMSVYGDAVFFPLLRPEIFLQEAHRLEVDASGTPSIQGVVYNEMKGAYSSFDTIAYNSVDEGLFHDSSITRDSGGDPLVIPQLTLAKLRAFHDRNYCPANCMVFLYGNIPTQEQLEFISTRFLSRFKEGGSRVALPKAVSNKKIQPFFHAYGPAADETKSTVVLAFKTTKTDGRGVPSFRRVMENAFLDELLWGDDSAPVSKALLKSGLGQDMAPQTMAVVEVRENYLSCGMRGVEEKNARQIEKVILDALEQLVQNGVSQEDFDRTCMGFDFDNREVKRANGPFSLIYLRRCLRGWTYGATPWESLLVRSEFDAMKNAFKKDPAYLTRLIRTLLVQNKNRSLVVVTPSASWSKKRDAAEKKLIVERLRAQGKEKTLRQMEQLHVFQQTEHPDADRCIPHLKTSSLSKRIERIVTRQTLVQNIVCFENREPTNGIVYVDVAFPVDVLSPADYPYLPLLAATMTQVGWGERSWEETMQLIGRTTGSFTAVTKCGSLYDQSRKTGLEKWQGRDWLFLSFKMLDEQTENAFSLAADCLTKTHFTDTRRLKDLLVAQFNSDKSEVLQYGHWFASLRAARTTCRSTAVAEIWNGISSLFTEKQLCTMNPQDVAARFERLLSQIQKGGAVLHVTADQKGLVHARKCLPTFVSQAGLRPLHAKVRSSEQEFFSLTELPASVCLKHRASVKTPIVDELFIIPGNVGFAASTIPNAGFDTRESAADSVFANAIEKTTLWEQVRTVGGAYGVMFYPDSATGWSSYSTYRDPKPYESLSVFADAIKSSSETVFSPELVEKTVTGTYSSQTQPKTPAGRGGTGFMRELCGMSNEIAERSIKWIISIKSKDLHLSALRYSSRVDCMRSVILCANVLISEKMKQDTGKIVKLPL